MNYKESLQSIKEKMKLDSSLNLSKIDEKILKNKVISTPYNHSEKIALKLGFIEIEDIDAFNGRYFVKDNKIWIHNIEALKSKLCIYDEEELKSIGYDVETYYSHENEFKSQKKVPKKLRMYDEKEKTGMDCGLENMVYMSDGVYIHKNDCWW